MFYLLEESTEMKKLEERPERRRSNRSRFGLYPLVPLLSYIMPPPIFMKIDFKYKWFVMRDFDSMLMLFLDNMSSLIGILGVMAFAIRSP